MALFLDYANVSTGNPATALDTRNTTQPYNGALNALGSLYAYPCNTVLTGNGQGSALIIKYVRYNSTTNAAVLAAPAPVYWADETYTTVTGTLSEAVAGVNSIAGLMLLNSVSLSGFTATVLNGNFIWIALVGFVAAMTSVGQTFAAGDAIIGLTGNFVVGKTVAGTAPTNLPLGFAQSATASSLVDVMLTLPVF